uniref:Transposase n=1 Tax=Globodera rostochiensis TaxID=31243 RepID=A0A914HQC6_GLORO
MEEFWILIFVAFLATKSLDKAESVKVKLELKTFDEIFGEGWWDKGEAEDLKMPEPTNFGQNVHHQIDRQNTQIGQIEPNSTDQNPPLTESDHSDNAKNGEEENEIIKEITSNENNDEDERRHKIIDKFHAIKDEFKQKGKYSDKERQEIDKTVAKELGLNFTTIYAWKRELGQIMTNYSDDEKLKIVKQFMRMKSDLSEKFDQRKDELKRDGFKNSYKEINETVAKELGLNFATIYNWKRKLGQTAPKHMHSHSEQKELMKLYYEIKDKTPKLRNQNIAKRLKIGRNTLNRWKKQFKHPNSVDGHSVEENASANLQEIKNINLGSI